MKQEPSYCYGCQLFQAAQKLHPSQLVVEKGQQRRGEGTVKAFLPYFSECQKMFFEQHPSVPKDYYIELFPSQVNLISTQLQQIVERLRA